MYNFPTISDSWVVLNNYLWSALITKKCLLQVSICKAIGEVHDALVIEAMSKAEGMSQFMNYLLGGSFQK
jgi:hypothetical protein